MTVYLYDNWSVSGPAALLILALHYGFWFWQFGGHIFFMGYGGPLAPAIGLSACLMWFFYLRGLGSRGREGREGQTGSTHMKLELEGRTAPSL